LAIIFLSACKNSSKTMSGKASAVFNHLAIYVADLKTSLDFYTQIIGLDTVPEPFHDGKHAWLDMGNKTKLHIIQGPGEKKVYFQNNHCCLSVASVDDFIAKLESNKIEYANAKGEKHSFTKRVDGIKQVFFQDPDGYWVEINDDSE